MGRAVQVGLLLAVFSVWPRTAAGDETFTEFGLDIGAAGRYTVGAESGSDVELVLAAQTVRIGRGRYRGYGLELSYVGSDDLEFLALLPRVEVGLAAPRFNRRKFGDRAHAWVPYFAVAAGYGSGTVWDTEYLEIYGTEEQVEVLISGVPMYGALGYRRIGLLSLRIEAVGGLILVTSEEADEPEGDAPSLIPSVGFRIAIGVDSFTYVWR